MSDRMKITQFARDCLERNKPLVILSIVGVRGSSPRHAGSKMVLDADGNCRGTIGGSLLEVEAVRRAGLALTEQASCCMRFRMDSPGAYSDGMICGGNVKVLLDYVVPSDENRSHFETLCKLSADGQDHVELTLLHGPDEGYRKVDRGIGLANGKFTGSLPLSPSEREEVFACLSQTRRTALLQADDHSLLIEPSIPIITLYCMGAGHVAKPTVQIASMTGFRVVVIDDRPNLALAECFPGAARIKVIQDFREAFDGCKLDRNSFVAIFTRGHKCDRIALEEALKTKAGYIGLMSSKRKRSVILEALQQNGFSERDIGRVHSPIGMNIRAETPEELAVSIVAELIDQRGILLSQP